MHPFNYKIRCQRVYKPSRSIVFSVINIAYTSLAKYLFITNCQNHDITIVLDTTLFLTQSGLLPTEQVPPSSNAPRTRVAQNSFRKVLHPTKPPALFLCTALRSEVGSSEHKPPSCRTDRNRCSGETIGRDTRLTGLQSWKTCTPQNQVARGRPGT